MILRPFFYYRGSKYRGAPRYPAPRHATIVEPFCGGAGFSLRHHERRIELYDLNPTLIGVWDYLIRAPSSEILALPLIAGSDLIQELPIVQEARDLIGYCADRIVITPLPRLAAFYASPDRPRTAVELRQVWGECRRSLIAAQQQHIRHWSAICASYDALRNPPVTWFIDPPYRYRTGIQYKHGTKGIDYDHLGQWCRDRHGQAIVCEQEGADWLPFRAVARCPTRVARAGRARTYTEVAWAK